MLLLLNIGLFLLRYYFLGFGSAIFHPEGSRVSFMAAGSKRGLAQSIYQVGGNSGQALAPLISAYIFDIFGQRGAAIVLVAATFGIILLTKIARWYKKQLEQERAAKKKTGVGFDIATTNKEAGRGSFNLTIYDYFLHDHFIQQI
ncbi:MFS transporter [Lysinibacillus sp. MHQ-1]|nr:MFS transporter [Lysinibacillus sp. MHQ-1]